MFTALDGNLQNVSDTLVSVEMAKYYPTLISLASVAALIVADIASCFISSWPRHWQQFQDGAVEV